MTSHLYPAESRDRAIAERLYFEFEPVLPPAVVYAALTRAERDLSGQIVPEARDEMIYRLARYRLGQISSEDAQR